MKLEVHAVLVFTPHCTAQRLLQHACSPLVPQNIILINLTVHV